MQSFILGMLLSPLIGSIVNGLLLRSNSAKRSGVIATLASGISFACATILAFEVLHKASFVSVAYPWFQVGDLQIRWGFLFDSLTAIMALVVTGIGTIIHFYSIGYMSNEKTPYRYFAYLNLFLFSMLTLINAESLPVMFVGWEGVGLCSYLLIGYWYQDPEKAAAGMKAFLLNRIGDAGFLLGIFFCYEIFHTLDFQIMKELMTSATDAIDPRILNFATLFLFVGAMGKSAQIPLYVWLPDAMAGPTPVSALIHAATMVTAGIYLIVRMSFVFSAAETTSFFIACIGAATALLAALIAIAQRDIKKVLAYSTVSQLGLMFLALGTHNYVAALFHVVTHAFFKALLFLGSGSVIHGLHGEQDITHMGGLKKKMPITHATFFIGTLAIAGIPPLAGFFSKDLLLYGAAAHPTHGPLFWALGSFTSLLTAFYMARVYALTFLGDYRGHAHPHESPFVMALPLVLLAIGSIFAGLLCTPEDFHLAPNFLEHFLSPVVLLTKEPHAFLTEFQAMGIATVFAILGVAAGLLLYGKGLSRAEKIASKVKVVQTLLLNKFYVDELYGLTIVKPFEYTSRFLARFVDPKVIDGLVIFPSRVVRASATLVSFFQFGLAQGYIFVMLVGTLLLFWFSFRGLV